MLELRDIIDFLLDLLRDPAAAEAFEQDPHAALRQAGLQDATGQDVRDAQLLLADSGAARSDATGSHHHTGGDPVQEIRYTTQHFHAVPDAPDPQPAPTITIDDRDTFFVRNSVDSHDVTVIEDSFNDVSVADNSVDNSVDNSIGTVSVDDSVDNSSVVNDVVAIQDNDVTTVDTTAVTVQDDDTITQVAQDTATDGPGDVDPDPTDAGPDAFAPDAEPDPEPEPDHHLDADVADPGLDLGPDTVVA